MLITCLKIFISRIIDVSLGSIRTLYIVKGNKFIASIIAFIEIIVWYYAASSVLLTYDNNIFIILFYALGYATGTYIGTFINNELVSGIYSIFLISKKINTKNLLLIKKNNIGITKLNDNMYFITINKKKYKEFKLLINDIDEHAFIVINDAKLVFNGYIRK